MPSVQPTHATTDMRWAGERVGPERVLGAIVEVPKAEVEAAVQQVVESEIPNLWIHMGCETPAALALAREAGIDVRHGTCAVMYTQPGFSFHSIHKGIMKLLGKY